MPKKREKYRSRNPLAKALRSPHLAPRTEQTKIKKEADKGWSADPDSPRFRADWDWEKSK